MSKANVMYSNQEVIISSGWKSRFSSNAPLRCSAAMGNITFPVKYS